MRYFFVIFVFLLLIECSGLFASVIRKNINSGWRFSLDKEKTWRDISLNMDYDTCKWRSWGNINCSKWNVSEKKEIVGIYRREDVFTENDLKNEYIYLFLSGISEKGEIFANGHSVAAKDVITDEDRWLEPLYGNIRPYLHNGKNRIEIKITDREGKGVLYAPVKYVISDRELDLGDFYPSVDELNPEFFNYMNQALRRKCPEMLDYLNGTDPFSLFWFTDVHGDGLVLERLMKFYNNYKFFFDDAIHTGDAVDLSFISDFTFWDEVSGTDNVLQTIGNHENLKTHINYDWVSFNPVDQKSQYDKFFSPYIGNWGVNYTDGKTYYFKDYNDKKIRLFVLDFCLFGKDNEEQIFWFRKGLEEAKEKDYSVLVASHSMPGVSRFERISCSFSDLDTVPGLSIYGKTKEELREYQTAAENFRAQGGKFVAWIGGHCHFDFVGYSDEFPNQLMIFLDSCNRGHSENFNDMSRVDGEKSMDLANALVVDTDDNLLKIVRVGADLDRYMRKRDFLCINYITKEIYR